MKKALTLVVLIITPTMASAQGTVVLQNTTGLVKQWTSTSDSTLINVPKSGGYVQLIAAPIGTALPHPLFSGSYPNYRSLSSFLAANPGWDAARGPNGNSTPNPAPIAIGPGLFSAGPYTINNIAEGANAEYFVIGWTGNYTSFDAAAQSGTGFFGESAIATTATGDPLAVPTGTPISLRNTFQGMTLGPGCLGPYFWFTTQPISQTVVLGATATFYVGATACPGPFYQWYFNGESIPGATGNNFQISNAQLINAGTYWAVLSNPSWGVHTSGSATLTVLPTPIITSPPQSQTAFVGATVDFRTGATGSPPLAYQWFLNTTNALSAGADPVLRLTNVQPAQAGAYTVVVTNIAGAVTSPPAMFSVIPPVERRMVPALSLLGQAGSLLNLEEANTLDPSPAWVTFDNVRLTNTSQWYFDVSTPLPPQRFYRAWQTAGLSVIPTLSLYMVPAITLTGPLGSSMRVDYINQFGPIDAWVALDTVTLTNTSQLYFDVSALRQPPRLYRLVPVP